MLVPATLLAIAFAGVLNGRVLCVNGPQHVVVEAAHSGPHDGNHHHHDGEDHGDDRCFDIKCEATLVRDATASPLDNVHLLVAPALVPPVLTPVLPSPPARSFQIAYPGPPPAFDDLARLSEIVLLV